MSKNSISQGKSQSPTLWQPPEHLPDALQPGGLAENVFKIAAQRQGVNLYLLKQMQEGLEHIRQHTELNSKSATKSPETMKQHYRAVLLKKDRGSCPPLLSGRACRH